ncbi:MAG: hypothetical protein ACYC48_00005, partial [Minisyncoccota bacterium]
MTGISGFFALLLIFGLVMYWEHAKKVAVAIGQAAGSGLQGISGSKGILWGVAAIVLLWWLYQSNLTITVVAAWVWNHLLFS